MSTIKDILINYKSADLKTKRILSQKLYVDLMSSNEEPYIKMLLLILEIENQGVINKKDGVSYEKVIEVCDNLNIKTLDDLMTFDINRINLDYLTEILIPRLNIDYDNLKNVSASFISDILKLNLNLTNAYSLRLLDKEYKLLKETDLAEILQRSRIDKQIYEPELNDCDNFAKKLISFAEYNGIVNCIGKCLLTFYDKYGIAINNHACNIAVLDNEEVVLIEPQTDMIIKKGYKSLLGTWSNKYKVYDVEY